MTLIESLIVKDYSIIPIYMSTYVFVLGIKSLRCVYVTYYLYFLGIRKHNLIINTYFKTHT